MFRLYNRMVLWEYLWKTTRLANLLSNFAFQRRKYVAIHPWKMQFQFVFEHEMLPVWYPRNLRKSLYIAFNALLNVLSIASHAVFHSTSNGQFSVNGGIYPSLLRQTLLYHKYLSLINALMRNDWRSKYEVKFWCYLLAGNLFNDFSWTEKKWHILYGRRYIVNFCSESLWRQPI